MQNKWEGGCNSSR